MILIPLAPLAAAAWLLGFGSKRAQQKASAVRGLREVQALRSTIDERWNRKRGELSAQIAADSRKLSGVVATLHPKSQRAAAIDQALRELT